MARIRIRFLSVAIFCALTAGAALPQAAISAPASSTASAKATAKAKAAKKVVARKSGKATPKKHAKSTTASRQGAVRAVAYKPSVMEESIGRHLAVRSNVAFVQDLDSSDVLYAKNEDIVAPIASITKLMTALVVVEAHQPLDEMIEVTTDDIDTRKFTHSRLVVGTRLSREDMLHLALMSSENRAANALGRNYPGGLPAFVAAMNAKAAALGMHETHYIEPTGLSSENVSSPRDLVRLMREASKQPLIHRFTTDTEYTVDIAGRQQAFHNTNRLVARSDWDIMVSKTGFINEAGQCLIMLAKIGGRDMAIVLLDSVGSLTRTADAQRVQKWVEREVGSL